MGSIRGTLWFCLGACVEEVPPCHNCGQDRRVRVSRIERWFLGGDLKNMRPWNHSLKRSLETISVTGNKAHQLSHVLQTGCCMQLQLEDGIGVGGPTKA